MRHVTKTLFQLVCISVFAASYAFADAKLKGTIKLSGQTDSERLKLAKISLVDAIQKATKKNNGKATEAELEEENGFLVFSVEVLGKDQRKRKVYVDAGTGEILKPVR